MAERSPDRLAGLLVVIAVLIALAGGLLVGRMTGPPVHVTLRQPLTTENPPLREGAGILSCFSNPFPPASLFGLSGVRACYQSAFSYEANLLDGRLPVTDSDYLLSFGASELVHLPGTRWDRYTYRGSVYVDGSGWVIKFRTPTGGRFAFLHMISTPGPRLLPPLAAERQPGPIAPTAGFDQTAVTVGFAPAASSPSVKVGGTRAGYSGWPIYPQYANGAPGPADAHLCLIADASSLRWFWRVAQGRDYHHEAFSAIRAWYAWADGHHRSRSSVARPWRHGALTPTVRFWQHHRWLRGVRSKTHWIHRAGAVGYHRTRFACGTVIRWTAYHTSKAVRHACV